MSDSREHRQHPPVNDWVNDFDHIDPRWTDDPFPIWEEMRAASPDRAHGALHRLLHATTYEAVRAIAYDTEHFSSRRIIVRDAAGPRTGAADHLRSARASPAAHGAAAAVHARCHEEAGAAGARSATS